jgi:nitroimidazol reductase NimA-like FMN-containing flavoprotein (pyridoxamine 5'-phosphate oxidase superfamily)
VTRHYPAGPRTSGTRLPERARYDAGTVHAVLDEAVMCHVGFVVEGRPVVLPHLHARVGERLYLHGSTGARALRAAGDGGLDVCVTVSLLDGLVLARSAFHHSVNYRSVVVLGRAVVVPDDEKAAALDALVDAIVPGRSTHVRPGSRKELAATTVLRLDLEEVSAKVRSGPPSDDDEDLELPHWAGVLPLQQRPGAPLPAPDLRAPVPVPAHVAEWARPAPSGPDAP